jgi:PAS domain S-box-containing protein
MSMPMRVQAGACLSPFLRFFARRRRVEDRFRGLLDCEPDAMLITDSQGTIAFVNSQTEKLFGYSRSELIGKPIQALIPDDFDKHLSVHRVGRAAEPHLHPIELGLEFSARKKNGTEFPVEISLSPLDSDDGHFTAAAVRDITERKLAYEQITKLNHELEHALQRSEKLAVMGLLATTIAHEINNPLAAITNSLYLLENNHHLDETSRSVVAVLQREVARIVEVARLTLGQQRESNLPIRINLSELLDETCAVFAARMDKLCIRVTRAYQCNRKVAAHPGEMRQVFMNLVANAIDAMPNGGELKLDIVDVGSTVRLTISDTGCGITEADMQHIFDPLFTTKGDKGTGIGLWLTKSIVERFQGRIEVSSSTKQGQNGTSFTIVFPATVFAEDDSSHVPDVSVRANVADAKVKVRISKVD